MRTAIVGCGAAGSARVTALAAIPEAEVLICVDTNPARAESMARTVGCEPATNWQRALVREDVEVVILATTTNTHAAIAIASMEAGKHVVCESPLARNPPEAEQMIRTSERHRVMLAAGATHRFSPIVIKAKELQNSGALGDIIFLRGWCGAGSWGGIETWYADPELSGGGTMMSNGIMLLDLARWFAGDFNQALGFSYTAMWPVEPVEDNAFGLFKSARTDRVASLHSSWTQWKGLLKLEIYGSRGYLELDMSAATVTFGAKPEGPVVPDEQVFDFSSEPDLSMQLELQDFFAAIEESREPVSSAHNGLRAVQMAHAVYLSSEKGATVRL